MIKRNSKNINKNKAKIENKNDIKEDYNSIVERIKLLRQNLKESNNFNTNYISNNPKLKRKKSIETNKKNKNRK